MDDPTGPFLLSGRGIGEPGAEPDNGAAAARKGIVQEAAGAGTLRVGNVELEVPSTLDAGPQPVADRLDFVQALRVSGGTAILRP